MEEEAADSLLTRLYEHQASDAFTCRVVWEPDTLVIWDNRCVLHNALFDYAGYKRRMHRVTIEGDRPTYNLVVKKTAILSDLEKGS